MGANSKIEWTHHTFNPWRGCTKVSDGCKFCYAETMSGRNPSTLGVWGPRGTRVIAAESYWRQPRKWDAEAKAAGERRRVFCASLADVFEGPETMPGAAWSDVEKSRQRLLALITETPHLDWLLLTKRPQNAVEFARPEWGDEWPHNVWLGTSVENQAAADERIPHLLNVPARVRFLSCEPLLGPVDLSPWIGPDVVDVSSMSLEEFRAARAAQHRRVAARPRLHWVIVGGESGPKARPMHPEWARGLRDQCVAAGVAFHFKQWGEWVGGVGQESMYISLQNGESMAGGVTTHAWGRGYVSDRRGKAKAGRLLDGREWDELPL